MREHKQPKATVTITMKSALLEKLKAKAEAEDRSLSQQIERLLTRKFCRKAKPAA